MPFGNSSPCSFSSASQYSRSFASILAYTSRERYRAAFDSVPVTLGQHEVIGNNFVNVFSRHQFDQICFYEIDRPCRPEKAGLTTLGACREGAPASSQGSTRRTQAPHLAGNGGVRGKHHRRLKVRMGMAPAVVQCRTWGEGWGVAGWVEGFGCSSRKRRGR